MTGEPHDHISVHHPTVLGAHRTDCSLLEAVEGFQIGLADGVCWEWKGGISLGHGGVDHAGDGPTQRDLFGGSNWSDGWDLHHEGPSERHLQVFIGLGTIITRHTIIHTLVALWLCFVTLPTSEVSLGFDKTETVAIYLYSSKLTVAAALSRLLVRFSFPDTIHRGVENSDGHGTSTVTSRTWCTWPREYETG